MKTFLSKLRCFAYGAAFASVMWAAAAYPHIDWRLHAGNQSEEIAQAAEQSVAMAKLLPSKVTK